MKVNCLINKEINMSTDKTNKKPHLLVRSIAQEVNIGDIAQGPGILALIEKYIPEVQVKLLASGATPEIENMLKKRFPDVEIIQGRFTCDGNDIVAPDKQKVIDIINAIVDNISRNKVII